MKNGMLPVTLPREQARAPPLTPPLPLRCRPPLLPETHCYLPLPTVGHRHLPLLPMASCLLWLPAYYGYLPIMATCLVWLPAYYGYLPMMATCGPMSTNQSHCLPTHSHPCIAARGAPRGGGVRSVRGGG